MKSLVNTRRDFLKRAAFGAAGMLGVSGLDGRLCDRTRGRASSQSLPAVRERPRETPVVHECDICVVGGGCTGVFAALRAARLGADVAPIENNGFFGGVATTAKVDAWHSRYDTAGEREIIGGLTVELIERLVKRQSAHIYAKSNPSRYAVPGKKSTEERWRQKREVNPTFYQVPYRSIVPRGSQKVLCAGRMVDADRGAFGAVRVMVNCNQMGEDASSPRRRAEPDSFAARAVALQCASNGAEVSWQHLTRSIHDGRRQRQSREDSAAD